MHVLGSLISQCLCLCHTNTKAHQPSPPTTMAASTEQKMKPICRNCGGVHLMKNCFQAGDAMEGKWDEVLALRAPRPSQAHVVVADVGDTGPRPNADSNDFKVMDLTSINLVAMSTTRPLSAELINYSLYAMSMISNPTIGPIYVCTTCFSAHSLESQALALPPGPPWHGYHLRCSHQGHHHWDYMDWLFHT